MFLRPNASSVVLRVISVLSVLVLHACGDPGQSLEPDLEGSPDLGTVRVELPLVAWQGAGSPEVERLDFVVTSRGIEVLSGSTTGPRDNSPLVWETSLDLAGGDYVISFALFDRVGELLCWADGEFVVSAGEDTLLSSIPLACTL